MSYKTNKWTIFIALLLTIPAMLFLVQVVMFFPAIFFLAGIVFMIPKALTQYNSTETLWFISIFGIHFLVYFGFFYLLSIVAAKFISFIQSGNVRKVILATILVVLFILTRLPVYGAGGHGPFEWLTLSELMADLDKSYGSGAVITVYGISALLIGSCILLLRNIKKSKVHLS